MWFGSVTSLTHFLLLLSFSPLWPWHLLAVSYTLAFPHLRPFALTILSLWNALPLDIYIVNTYSFLNSSLKHHLVNEGFTDDHKPARHPWPPSLCSKFFPFHLSSLTCYVIYSFIMHFGSCLFPPTRLSTPQGQKVSLGSVQFTGESQVSGTVPGTQEVVKKYLRH